MSKLNLKTLKKGDRIRITLDGAVVEDFVFGRGRAVALAGAFGWYLLYDSVYLGHPIGARGDGETGAVYADRGWEVEKI